MTKTVQVKDWTLLAEAAGRHNIRFPTNWRLEAFLTEILGVLDLPEPEPIAYTYPSEIEALEAHKKSEGSYLSHRVLVSSSANTDGQFESANIPLYAAPPVVAPAQDEIVEGRNGGDAIDAKMGAAALAAGARA